MKAKLNGKGNIVVEAETLAEAYAVKYLTKDSVACGECGQIKIPLIINLDILARGYDNATIENDK